MNLAFYSAILPEIAVVGGAILVLLVDLFQRATRSAARNSTVLSYWGLAAVVVAAILTFNTKSDGTAVMFQTSAVADTLTFVIRLVVLATTALVLLIGSRYVPSFTHQIGEYYTLLLICTAAMMAMAMAADLIMLFLALETFSLSLILLTGMFRENPHSTEASMKYFLLSAFASAFFVYGGALIYGATGTINLAEMASALIASNTANTPLLQATGTLPSGPDNLQNLVLLSVGVPLLLVGFGFKLSVVPFHMWTPDVYQGAPTTVTAFMSVGTKTAVFGALIRLFILALPATWADSISILSILAVLTMTVGNLTALSQTSLKRMLGYSSIAHAGYLLAGLVPGTLDAVNSALFYLFAYAFMNVGAFIIIIAIEQAAETDIERSQLRGAGKKSPLLAGFMALFLFSLSGIPPLAGFFGKFLLFRSIVEGGFLWLAVATVLNSALSAYYYLRVIVTMYFWSDAQPMPTAQSTRGLYLGMAVAGIMVLAIGLFPSFWLQLLAL